MNGLTITLASVSILITDNPKIQRENLIAYTNYYVAIALKAFSTFNKKNKNYTSVQMAKKAYTTIYSDYFNKAQQDVSIINDDFKFKSEFKSLSDDEKLIISATLSLSGFYGTKSLNSIKHLLRTYISKIKKCIKAAPNYIKYFSTAYSEFTIKSILLNFLIENS